MEIDNAVNQARKEISTRFDFKGSVAEIDFDRKTSKLGLHASDDYKLEAVWQVLQPRLIARKVPLPNLKRGEIEPASGNTVRQAIDITRRSTRTRRARSSSSSKRASTRRYRRRSRERSARLGTEPG